MKNNIKPKKWIALFFAIVFILAALCSLMTYIVDPFFQFRVRDNTYVLNGRYVAPGLIENYDYDTLFVGSSMIQNNDADVMRRELGGKPLNIGLGGMNSDLMLRVLKLAGETGKAERYFVCIDLASFTNSKPTSNQTYLFDGGLLSKLRYMFSYEVWFRYLPTDAALLAAKKLGISVPEKYKAEMSVDRLEYWADDFNFGRDETVKNYKSDEYGVSAVDTENLRERMLKNIDGFISQIDFENGEYTFFFPPYSSLFWCNAQDRGYFDEYLEAKEYCVKKLCENGCRVFDFQAEDFTTDLENYKDITHYSTEINDLVVCCLGEGRCETDAQKAAEQTALLRKNTADFRENNSEIFEAAS